MSTKSIQRSTTSVFYLRIVHSVDFYNHSEYPNEDEMPNRCGILHARGGLPTGKTKSSEIEVSHSVVFPP